MANPHLIKHHIFALKLDREEHANALYDQVRDLFYLKIQRGIADLLDQLPLHGHVLQLDRLELDLGQIPMDMLEEGLAPRLLEALAAELKQLPLPKYSSSEEVHGFSRTQLALLQKYLCEGVLPWNTTHSVGHLWQHLTQEAPEALAQLIRQEGQRQTARQRVADRMMGDMATAILRVLEPTQSDLIMGYHQHLIHLNQEHTVVQSPRTQLERTLWGFVLNYLLVEEMSGFNARSMVRSTLRQIANHYGVSFLKLVQLLHLGLQSWGLPYAPTLLHVVQEVTEEFQVNVRVTSSPVGSGMTSYWEVTRTFLETGRLAQLPQGVDLRTLEFHLLDTLDKTPGAVANWLRKLNRPTPTIHRIAAQLEETIPVRLLAALIPTESDTVIGYHQHLTQLHSRQPLVPAAGEPLRRHLWELILLGVLDQQGSRFNRREFLKSLLQGMARHHNLEYGQLLTLTLHWAPRHLHNHTAIGSFIGLLQELSAEVPPIDAADLRRLTISADDVPQAIQQLEITLSHWQARQSVDTTHKEALVHALEHQPQSAIALLRQHAHQPWVLQYLAETLGDKALPQLVQYIHRQQQVAFQQWWQEVQAFQEELNEAFPQKRLSEVWLTTQTMQSLLRHQQLSMSTLRQELMSAWQEAYQMSAKTLLATLQGKAHTVDTWAQSAKIHLPDSTIEKPEASAFNPYPETLNDVKTDHIEEWLLKQLTAHQEIAEVTLREWILTALQDAPQSLVRVLEQLGEFHGFWKRLPVLIPATSFAQLMATLTGISATLWARRLEAIAAIKAQLQQEGLRLTSDDDPWQLGLLQLWHQHGKFSPEQLTTQLLLLWAEETHQNPEALRDLLQATAAADWQELLATWGQDTASLAGSTGKTGAAPRLTQLLLAQLTQADMKALKVQGFQSVEELNAFLIDFHETELWQAMQAQKSDLQTTWAKVLQAGQRERLLSRQPGLASRSAKWLSLLRKYLTQQGYHRTTEVIDVLSLTLFTWLLGEALPREKALLQRMDETLGQFDVPLGPLSNLPLGVMEKALTETRDMVEQLWQASPSRSSGPAIKFTDEDPGRDYYLKNAGLILLHPYLPHFFGSLGYLNESGMFLSQEKAAQGAFLLQYLYNLQTTQDEEQMLLNKLLCGMQLAMPTPAEYHPTEAEKEWCDGMINALVSQWEIIGAHDVSGFRDTWLWRTGKLTVKADKAKLVVDPKPYDILMDSLPYTLSPAMMAWADKPIYVEWR